jgi:hypothetical protein
MGETLWLRRTPVEIILNIMSACKSTRDILALAATCRTINEVWRANSVFVILPIWKRELQYFNDALLAVGRIHQISSLQNI